MNLTPSQKKFKERMAGAGIHTVIHHGINKHLQGKHDQSMHGRKGPVKAGFEHWYGQVDSLIAAADKSKKPIQSIVIERAGFLGKPSLTTLDAIPKDQKIYRGTTTSGREEYLENPYPWTGQGGSANGTYYTDWHETAEDYATNEIGPARLEAVRDRLIVAQLQPDANVLDFNSPKFAGKFTHTYAIELQNEFISGYEKHLGRPLTSQESTNVHKLTDGPNWTNLLIMQGYDAMVFNADRKPWGEPERYTIVWNRGKVKVANDMQNYGKNGF